MCFSTCGTSAVRKMQIGRRAMSFVYDDGTAEQVCKKEKKDGKGWKVRS